MSKAELIACWRSGQIEPDEMVRLCADDPDLKAMILGKENLKKEELHD